MGLTITLSNVWAYARGDSMSLYRLRETLSIEKPGARFMPTVRQGKWDGIVRYVDRRQRFPVGLLGYVDLDYEWVDNRDKRIQFATIAQPKGGVLRDYQEKAVLKSLLTGNGIINVATNGGKSYIMASIIKTLLNYDYTKDIIVIIHRQELFEQLVSTFRTTFDIDVGEIKQGVFNKKQVTLCMVQTLGNRITDDEDNLEWLRSAGGIFVDECHHAVANTYQFLLSRCGARYRFGFSGSVPDKSTYDGMEVRKFLGPVLSRVSNDFLIKRGISALPIINILHIYNNAEKAANIERKVWAQLREENPHAQKLQAGTKIFNAIYDKFVVNNKRRNKKIAKIVKQHPGKNVLIVVDAIDHGNNLNEIIPGSVFVNGETESGLRAKTFADFKAGEQKILIATNIVDEGIDISRIEVLILAGARKSRRQYIQRIGRGLRKKEQSNTVQIYDFYDHGHRLLEKHSSQRLNLYNKEGFRIEDIS